MHMHPGPGGLCRLDAMEAAEQAQQAGMKAIVLKSHSYTAAIAAADIITLHCPLIDKTRDLINAETISRMKPGARLINCARGGLVNESALYEALQSGHLAGAALDVFANEPPQNSPLFELDNIVFETLSALMTKNLLLVVKEKLLSWTGKQENYSVQ